MCLNLITETFDPPLKEMSAFKVLIKEDLNKDRQFYRGLFCPQVELGQWYTAQKCPSSVVVNYDPGFHCFCQLEDAMLCYEDMDSTHFCVLSVLVNNVRLKGEESVGLQFASVADVIVADKMMLIKELK